MAYGGMVPGEIPIRRWLRHDLRGCVCTGRGCLAMGCPACFYLRPPGCVLPVIRLMRVVQSAPVVSINVADVNTGIHISDAQAINAYGIAQYERERNRRNRPIGGA